MTKQAGTQARVLDVRDVRRAVYIDFEGTQVDPPSLIGVLVDDEFTQYVFEPQLASAARAKSVERGGTCVFTTRDEAFADIRRRIEAEDRMAFAWSGHEEDTLVDCVTEAGDRLFWASSVTNAIPLARIWKRRHHRQVVFPRGPRGRSARHTLARYCDLVGYRIPKIHGPGNTAQRIRFVRDALRKRGSYEQLTTVQKNKWANLLQHNRHDCEGLRHVLEHIALDRPGRSDHATVSAR